VNVGNGAPLALAGGWRQRSAATTTTTNNNNNNNNHNHPCSAFGGATFRPRSLFKRYVSAGGRVDVWTFNGIAVSVDVGVVMHACHS